MSEIMANVNVVMEKSIKDEANRILKEMGLNMSTYINMAVRQLIKEQAIPFKVTAYKNRRENLKGLFSEVDYEYCDNPED